MACMCGDTHCRSCGPAQGNDYCSVCKRWADDGGCENPEECNHIAREQDEAEAKAYADGEAILKQYDLGTYLRQE